MRGTRQDGRMTWTAPCQKPYTPNLIFCLAFLAKYVFMFCNGYGAAWSRGVPLVTGLLYCICVSVEARVASQDFVNFVIGKP